LKFQACRKFATDIFDGVLTYPQLVGGFAIGESIGYERDHLFLARR